MKLRASLWGWKYKNYAKSFMKTFWTVIIYHQRKMAFQAILHMLVIYVDITCAQINTWKMPRIFCYNFMKCVWQFLMSYMTCHTLLKQTRSVCPATHQFHWSLVHEKWPTYYTEGQGGLRPSQVSKIQWTETRWFLVKIKSHHMEPQHFNTHCCEVNHY